MLVLSEADLREILPMRDVIGAVERGFRAVADGKVVIPQRLQTSIFGGVFLHMPAYASLELEGETSSEQKTAGVKIASVFGENPRRGLEVVQATYLLLDGETGVPLSLMDGPFITALRTAATSALATRLMASPGPKRLGLFGAGVLAEFHAHAMVEVAKVGSISISSRTTEKAQALARRLENEFHIQCAVLSPSELASTSDLICTCTTSPAPVFPGTALRDDVHINAVGAFTPATREVDTVAVRRATVVIDAHEAAGSEAGDVLIPIAEGAITRSHIKGTLADLVSNRIMVRQSQGGVTIFKSCGLAIEDLVTAHLAYSRAQKRGVGTIVSM
ncbi:MAG TPA: ornithine cyclodeaminase family protein [Blastocatellia bacterium]|nr:ornithine cyclodeaminase family protein [Blastocatellia bacterium]